MWDYLFDIQLNNPPSNKEFPCKLIFTPGRSLHTWKIICSIEILFTVLSSHALRDAQITKHDSAVKSSRAQLVSQGLYYTFHALGDQRSNTTHTHD